MSYFSLKGRKGGFTLVEIMIVVLIIGILLAIAVPNFIKARETSRTKSCIANLSQISAAKDQYAMDNKLSAGDACLMATLTAAGGYLKSTPTCQSGGVYTVNAIDTKPACDKALHILP